MQSAARDPDATGGTICNQLRHDYERRVLLVEIHAEGLMGWGECVAGEHPYFSDESIDTAWVVLMQELAPMLAAAPVEHGGDCPEVFQRVRGNPMAKAALENAIWDLEAQIEDAPLFELLGGDARAHRLWRLHWDAAHDGAAAAEDRARSECGL